MTANESRTMDTSDFQEMVDGDDVSRDFRQNVGEAMQEKAQMATMVAITTPATRSTCGCPNCQEARELEKKCYRKRARPRSAAGTLLSPSIITPPTHDVTSAETLANLTDSNYTSKLVLMNPYAASGKNIEENSMHEPLTEQLFAEFINGSTKSDSSSRHKRERSLWATQARYHGSRSKKFSPAILMFHSPDGRGCVGELKGRLDTGAGLSIIQESHADHFGWRDRAESLQIPSIDLLDGKTVKVIGCFKATVTEVISQKRMQILFHVVKDRHLQGMDCLLSEATIKQQSLLFDHEMLWEGCSALASKILAGKMAVSWNHDLVEMDGHKDCMKQNRRHASAGPS